MELKGIEYKAEIIDGVIKLEGQVDIVEVLKELAAKSENSIDDMLVKIVELAKSNLDWKGYAKEQLG